MGLGQSRLELQRCEARHDHRLRLETSLENCAPEVVERIVEVLDLAGVCSLRRTCHGLVSSATQTHFKSYFRSKKPQLTESALRDFIALTALEGLGCLLRDITLVDIVYNRLD